MSEAYSHKCYMNIILLMIDQLAIPIFFGSEVLFGLTLIWSTVSSMNDMLVGTNISVLNEIIAIPTFEIDLITAFSFLLSTLEFPIGLLTKGYITVVVDIVKG